MEVPQRFIDKMTGTASNNVSWLIWEDQESLQEVSSISELLLASCGSLSRDERDFLSHCGPGQNERRLGPSAAEEDAVVSFMQTLTDGVIPVNR